MHDNDRHAAQAASRSRRALILAAATLVLLVPLVGCDLSGLDEAIAEGIAESLSVIDADVQVSTSSKETRVSACVTRGAFDLNLEGCKGPEDSFAFLAGEEWQYAPAGVTPLPGGAELTVHWSALEGKSTFSVVLPEPMEVTSPAAGAVYRAGDEITLQFTDPGADEVTIENKGSCGGPHTYDWWRVLPSDEATPGRLVVRAADLVHYSRAFESCDVTLRISTARPGTFTPGGQNLSGTITARTVAEVTFQIVP
ncbi:MAG: hypothetical protein HY906_05215 [Deltaproteobacteria bacterium]|nr:hypothetical protein [Deltaproteobacteria bacterium]